MAITLARVDDRVVHGQTVTRWATVKPCNAIIVISDVIAADDLRKKVLKAAAGQMKFGCYNIQQGVGALEKAKASKNNFFVIADSINEFVKLRKAGGDFGSVLNVGSLSGSQNRPGVKKLGNAICINDEDVEGLDYLTKTGVDVQFQLIPDDGIKSWASVKTKYLSM